jgi:AraC-like DNA-binding protein
VTLRLDSRQIPLPDRSDAVRELISATIVPVTIDFPEQVGPRVRAEITDLGAMRVCGIESNATKAERTARLAQDDTSPSIFVGLQATGSSLVVQSRRETVLRPGQLVLYESTTPYVLIDPKGVTQHQFRIPVDQLGLTPDVLRQVLATPLSPGDPVADLVGTYFGRIARDQASFEAVGTTIGTSGIELLRALIATHLDLSAVAAESLHATLRLRILEYAGAHLGDPTLDAARIAAEHHISVRQLYKVMAEGQVSLADWIRARRLEGCHTDLARPSNQDLPIARIARRWGFTNASSFARLFRTTYGMSPGAWQQLNRRGLGS